MPFLLAPIGAQGIIHEDGDLATARDAASLDVPFRPQHAGVCVDRSGRRSDGQR